MKNRDAAAEPKAAVIYTRVSSAPQVDGTSLATQLAECRRCAEARGLEVVVECSDAGRSAKSMRGRGGLERALRTCEERGAALLVYRLDRLARCAADALAIRAVLAARGCMVISATEGACEDTAAAQFIYSVMCAAAEYDNAVRVERVTAWLHARAMQGGWHGGRPPTGFAWTGRDAGGVVTLKPDGVRSPLIARVIRRLAAGKMTYRQALAALSSGLGVAEKCARKILESPIYGGSLRSVSTGWADVQTRFGGIVPRRVWDKAAAAIAAQKRRRVRQA